MHLFIFWLHVGFKILILVPILRNLPRTKLGGLVLELAQVGWFNFGIGAGINALVLVLKKSANGILI
jgi:hypothetical protein